MGSRHVWKTSTPIMVPPLTSLLVTANPCLLIVLIIIIKMCTTPLTDVLVNCIKMRVIWKEYLWLERMKGELLYKPITFMGLFSGFFFLSFLLFFLLLLLLFQDLKEFIGGYGLSFQSNFHVVPLALFRSLPLNL